MASRAIWRARCMGYVIVVCVHVPSSRPSRFMTSLNSHHTLLVALTALVGTRALAAQELFVSNEGSNTVTVISATTLKPLATIEVGKRPRGIALSPDGQRVYVALGLEDA